MMGNCQPDPMDGPLLENQENAEQVEHGQKKEKAALSQLIRKNQRLCWLDMSDVMRYLPAPRNSQGSTCRGSSLYIYGGRTPTGRVNDLWQFDCVRRQWQCLEPAETPSSPPVRSGCLLVHDGEHHLYVGFGYEKIPVPHNEMYKYDLYERKWSVVETHGIAPAPRINFQAWFLNGCIWLFGGSPDGTKCFGDLWKFDTRTNTWSEPATTGDIPPACQWTTAEIWKDSLVVLFGGHFENGMPSNVFHLLDCETLEWKKLFDEAEEPLFKQVQTFASHAVDELDVPPNSDDEYEQNTVLDVAPKWDTLFCSSPASAIYGDNLILWGGWNGFEHKEEMWCCNLSTLCWNRIIPKHHTASGPPSRGSASAIMFEGTLFLFGGWNGWCQTNQMDCVSFACPSLQRLCLEKLAKSDQVDLELLQPFLQGT